MAVHTNWGNPAPESRVPYFLDTRRRQRELLLILLLVLLVLALPTWRYSAGWGYFPSGGLGLVLIVVLFILLFGRRRPPMR